MELAIEAAGDITDRQELLNGTQMVALDGASGDGVWSVTGSLSWNIGLDDRGVEGDMTLSKTTGDELYATVSRGSVRELAGSGVDASEYVLRIECDIDGGAGSFEDARGLLLGEGVLSGASFTLLWNVSLTLPDAEARGE